MFIIPYNSYRFLTGENSVVIDYSVHFSFREYLKYLSYFDVQSSEGDSAMAVRAYTGILKGVCEMDAINHSLDSFFKFVLECVEQNLNYNGFNFEIDTCLEELSELSLRGIGKLDGTVESRYEELRGRVYGD